MTEKILNNPKDLQDEDLIEILFTDEDRVSRAVVDEFIRRGQRMIEPLWDIIRDTNNWQGDAEQWWAVIHATFILGAIGAKEAITPLIMSLRFADAYDCDWLLEALSSIFGKIGPVVLEPLKKVILDQSNNWTTRTIALEGIAAVTVNYPRLSREIFDFIAQQLKDPYEDMMVRGLAGNILLDFKQSKYQKSLLKFAEEEEKFAEYQPSYILHFSQDEVLEDLQSDKKHLEQYTRDWLRFYDEKEIQIRQERWKSEDKKNRWLQRLLSCFNKLRWRIKRK